MCLLQTAAVAHGFAARAACIGPMRFIVLLHGLNVGPNSMRPLAWYLRLCMGHDGPAVVIPRYDTAGITSLAVLLARVSASLDHELRRVGAGRDATLFVIGQSLGGIAAVNLHACGWLVAHAVTWGAPLHGARYIGVARCRWPFGSVLLRDPTYDFLLGPNLQQAPPHSFRTISFGMFTSSFDGCVHRDEATLDEQFHTHEHNIGHATAALSLQLWRSTWAALAPALASAPAHAPAPALAPAPAPAPARVLAARAGACAPRLKITRPKK
jgi:hypothetical protein